MQCQQNFSCVDVDTIYLKLNWFPIKTEYIAPYIVFHKTGFDRTSKTFYSINKCRKITNKNIYDIDLKKHDKLKYYALNSFKLFFKTVHLNLRTSWKCNFLIIHPYNADQCTEQMISLSSLAVRQRRDMYQLFGTQI